MLGVVIVAAAIWMAVRLQHHETLGTPSFVILVLTIAAYFGVRYYSDVPIAGPTANAQRTVLTVWALASVATVVLLIVSFFVA